MTGLILALLVGALLPTLVAHADMVEAGLTGLWETFVGFWRYLAQLVREGR